MKLVGDFLSKFKNIKPPDDTLKRALMLALEETLDIHCTPDRISIANGIAYIKTSSVAKNMIQINRSVVLKNLFDRFPRARDTVRDVR
ncbi:MAG: hypothetical protein ACE5F4_00030 [Candidatus Paceibacteria bacterium]